MPVTQYSLEQAETDIADLRAQMDRLGEVHTIDGSGGVVPNAVPGAAQLYTAVSGQPSYVTPSGLAMGSVGAQQAQFTNTTVTNSGTLASFTVPGGDASVGAVYELEVWGNGTQGSTRQSLTLGVQLGGTGMSNVNFGTGNFGAAGGLAFRWRAAARVICNTAGGAGTWTSYIVAVVSDFNVPVSSANANLGAGTSCESSGTNSKDTTVSQTLALTAAWGSTTGAPTLTSQVAVAKRIC